MKKTKKKKKREKKKKKTKKKTEKKKAGIKNWGKLGEDEDGHKRR